jgi:heptosyltransferase-3
MLLNKVDIARLIIRPGAIGDFILSLPALQHLRSAYTEVWTAEPNLPLVRFADAKRSIISAGLDRLALLPAEDVVARLRRFDSIVSWYGANRPEFRQFVTEAGLPFEFHQALPDNTKHAVDFYAAQVGLAPGAIPKIDPGPVDYHGAIIHHPFASSPSKRTTGFSLSSNLKLITLRGPQDHLPEALYIPDLYDLAKFIAGAKAYIGNDSGITHLAAAVGVPTIAIFRSTDPNIWSPRGPHVRVIRDPEAIPAALHDFGIS